MFALRRSTTSEWLSVTTIPVYSTAWFDRPAVALQVVADAEPDTPDDVGVIAIASMCRARRSEHDEVWAQLFIDGVFVDVVRAQDWDASGVDERLATFVAHIRVPAIYFDGSDHRAHVAFVSTVSRVVPKSGASAAPTDTEPQAHVEADFSAVRHRPKRPSPTP